MMKVILNDISGIAPLRHNSITYSDSKVKVNLLNDQFASVFSKETSNVSDICVPCRPYPGMNPIQFTSVGINKLL